MPDMSVQNAYKLLAPNALLRRALTTHDITIRKVALLYTLLPLIKILSLTEFSTLVRRTHGFLG